MKKTLIVAAVAVMGFATVINAADTVDSRVVDDALAYQKAGGKARFMGGDVLKVTEENYCHAETAKNYRNWMIKGANEGITHLRLSLIHISEPTRLQV